MGGDDVSSLAEASSIQKRNCRSGLSRGLGARRRSEAGRQGGLPPPLPPGSSLKGKRGGVGVPVAPSPLAAMPPLCRHNLMGHGFEEKKKRICTPL